MKIMQISPFGLPIRDDIRYGGIERVVRILDKYYAKDNESFVAATGDSEVHGTLCPTLPNSLWVSHEDKKNGWKYKKDVSIHDEKFEEHCLLALEHILKINPDIIHDHLGFIRSKAFHKAKDLPPILTTLHGPLNEDNTKRFEKLRKLNGQNVYFNAVSESQRRDFSEIINVDYVILNALDTENYPFQPNGENFVFSLGLVSPSKGTDTTIEAAKSLNEKIVVAGPIHHFVPEIRDFWENLVKPKIDLIYDKEIPPDQVGSFVEEFTKSNKNSVYIGELNDSQKKEWFKRAKAFYFPVRWKEPFGLVMVESMACGTPVIAYNSGSVPEVIKHNETGYIVKKGDFESFLDYASKFDKISREECRKHVEETFPISNQVSNYLRIYEEIVSKSN